MAKYKNKVQSALAARRAAWDRQSTNDRAGTTRPGSNNRKKGYGKGGRR